MYPTALLMLALDERDTDLVEGFLYLAPRLGLSRVVVAHCRLTDPLPEPLARSLPDVGAVPVPDLGDRVDALRAALPDVAVESRTGSGSPVEFVDKLDREMSPDLLVIGRAALVDDKDTWGPVGRNLLRHQRSCALVIPNGWKPPASGAVVGMDFSDHAIDALKVALRLFDDTIALYQFDPSHRPSGNRTETEYTLHLTDHAQQSYNELVLPHLGGAHPPLQVIADRRASDAIIERAGDDRVIVAGSRGLSAFAAMLLGSTAERIAGRSGAPVLIVRKKGEAMGVIEGLVHR